MHRARLAGLVIAAGGFALLAAILLGPVWLPLPRLLVIAGPGCALLGLAMVVHPGPKPAQGESFDFEDWYDEARLGEKIAYSASGLAGLAIGLWLFLGGSEVWALFSS